MQRVPRQSLGTRYVRSGFTLLEMILALAIGLVLMISLYSVLSMQVRQAQQGRLKLDEGTLARDILKRMTLNILCSMGAANPTPTAGGSSSSSSSSTAASSSYSTTINEAFLFNNGVYGNSGLLVLSTCKVPVTTATGSTTRVSVTDNPNDQATVSDLRRISYWMTPDGLAVQELDTATTNDMSSVPPDVPDGSYKILASEVKDVLFEFFDGTSFQSTWDGTQPGPDGVTPIGPPSAIRITLTFYRKGGDDLPEEQSKYQHVVAIPAGNNFSSTSQ